MKFRKRAVTCNSCERPLLVDQKVCGCGAATRFMDFQERTRYEVEQWKQYRQAAQAS